MDSSCQKEEDYFIVSSSFSFGRFCREYWLTIITAIFTLAVFLSPLFIKVPFDDKYFLLMLPANLFLRHIRGFVALFVFFSAANKARIFSEAKESKFKSGMIIRYFFSGLISLLVALFFASIIIPYRTIDKDGSYFKVEEMEKKASVKIFGDFLNSLSVHDLPLNLLTTRVDVASKLGDTKLKDGIGDGYNAPGFVVFGFLFAVSAYFMRSDGKGLRSAFGSIHKCLLGVYWVLVCYSPFAFLFAGLCTYNEILVKEDLSRLYTYVGFMLLTVLVVFFIQCLVVLPFMHLIRVGRLGFRAMSRIIGYIPTIMLGGSCVLTVDKTKFYLKSVGFDSDVIDEYFDFATVVDSDGLCSGFAVCAIFMLKLFGRDCGWPMILNLFITGLLVGFTVTEYLQGHLFGIIYVLNAWSLPPGSIVALLIVDWLFDRFRVLSNLISDVLAVDEIEGEKRSQCPHSGVDELIVAA